MDVVRFIPAVQCVLTFPLRVVTCMYFVRVGVVKNSLGIQRACVHACMQVMHDVFRVFLKKMCRCGGPKRGSVCLSAEHARLTCCQ